MRGGGTLILMEMQNLGIDGWDGWDNPDEGASLTERQICRDSRVSNRFNSESSTEGRIVDYLERTCAKDEFNLQEQTGVNVAWPE